MRNPFRRKNRVRSEARPLLLSAAVLVTLCASLAAVVVYRDPQVVHDVSDTSQRLAREAVRIAGRAAASVPGYLLERPYFAVQEIKVFGAQAADRAEIVGAAGLKRGLSIWRIDPQDLESKIRQHPWVKQVVVRRELPRRVILNITEWKPVGILALESLYYVDAEGVIFKALGEGDAVDFPLITGLRAAGLSPLDASTRNKLAQVLALGREVEEANLRLSEIRFVPEGEIILYPASARVPFTMGWGDWDEKLMRLKRFLREWNGQEAHFSAVDMSFARQAIARLRRSL